MAFIREALLFCDLGNIQVVLAQPGFYEAQFIPVDTGLKCKFGLLSEIQAQVMR